jgi:hypothetical protein
LPPGIILTELTPACYFATTKTDDHQDVTADPAFECVAEVSPTNKIKLGSRNVPGGGQFLIHLPIGFTAEIPKTASYKEGTVRFALETPTRNANVVVRIPVGYAPLIRYLEPSARFLEDMTVIDALIDTKGKPGKCSSSMPSAVHQMP